MGRKLTQAAILPRRQHTRFFVWSWPVAAKGTAAYTGKTEYGSTFGFAKCSDKAPRLHNLHLKNNVRFPRLRQMPVTSTPTEAGMMPLAANLPRLPQMGRNLAQAAILPRRQHTVLRGGRAEPRKVPLRTPGKPSMEVRSVSRNALDKAPRLHNPR